MRDSDVRRKGPARVKIDGGRVDEDDHYVIDGWAELEGDWVHVYEPGVDVEPWHTYPRESVLWICWRNEDAESRRRPLP